MISILNNQDMQMLLQFSENISRFVVVLHEILRTKIKKYFKIIFCIFCLIQKRNCNFEKCIQWKEWIKNVGFERKKRSREGDEFWWRNDFHTHTLLRLDKLQVWCCIDEFGHVCWWMDLVKLVRDVRKMAAIWIFDI